jgi:hypothetical protein
MKQTETKATLKRDFNYARVDEEATFILTYPDAQASIQGSWNWPDHRKGRKEHPYAAAGAADGSDGHTQGVARAMQLRLLPTLPLSWVARRRWRDTDSSSLADNLIIVHPRCGASLRGDRADN